MADQTLPDYETLRQRLEAQRSRALSARGICGMIASAAGAAEDVGGFEDVEDLVNLRGSLDCLTELLDSIKDAISPEELLAPAHTDEVPNE